jgi:sensor domain CHASE-containing protein
MLRRLPRWDQNLGLLILGAAIGIGVVSALIMFANAADQAAREREQFLVDRGIAGRLTELAQRTVSETTWDEAVERLDVSFDPSWADANIGQFLSSGEGFELAAVLDRTDAPIYAFSEGETVPAQAIWELVEAATPIVAQLRDAERRRGPIQPLLARLDGAVPEPILASAVVSAKGGLFALTATLVQPDLGTALPLTERSAIVLAGEAIDQEFLSVLAERYRLSNAQLGAPDGVVTRGNATVRIFDVSGQDVALIQWRPQRPGADMLRLSLPITLVALTLLGTLAWRFQCPVSATVRQVEVFH